MAENDELFNELPPIHTLVEADISCAAEFFFEALCVLHHQRSCPKTTECDLLIQSSMAKNEKWGNFHAQTRLPK